MDIFQDVAKIFNDAIDSVRNPTDRDQKREELEDHYSNVLFDMTDEELDNEYEDKIGKV